MTKNLYLLDYLIRLLKQHGQLPKNTCFDKCKHTSITIIIETYKLPQFLNEFNDNDSQN